MKNKTLQLLLLFIITSLASCTRSYQLALAEKLKKEDIVAVNRQISIYSEDEKAVEMNAKPGDGLGILEQVEFETGTIYLELLGENNPGRSFLGFAFNIQNDSTYEAVYFRPFNFVAKEQIRKDHMHQYIFHPEFTWRKLRAERTGEFENEILPAPNPDQWFRTKIEITEKTVRVFVNDSKDPSLEVPRLTASASKKIGLWTGFNSSGRFRNLSIKPN